MAKAGGLPAQPAEHRHDPADVVEAVGQVARHGDDVRLPGGAAVHDRAEIGAIRRAAQVQVAQVQDRQPVPRRRQARQVQRPLGIFNLQDLIKWQKRLEALLAGAGRRPAELFGHIDDLGLLFSERRRTRPQQAAKGDQRQQHERRGPAQDDVGRQHGAGRRSGVEQPGQVPARGPPEQRREGRRQGAVQQMEQVREAARHRQAVPPVMTAHHQNQMTEAGGGEE